MLAIGQSFNGDHGYLIQLKHTLVDNGHCLLNSSVRIGHYHADGTLICACAAYDIDACSGEGKVRSGIFGSAVGNGNCRIRSV